MGELEGCGAKIGLYDCCTIITGDCLDVAREVPDESLDLLVVDPPYASGARRESSKTLRGSMVRGEGVSWFEGDNLTTHGLAWFLRANALEWMRVLRPHSHLCCFTDWRMYPIVSAVLESAGLRLVHCLVWDKVHFGMGWQFRNQHEFIVVASKGQPREPARHDVGTVIAVPRRSGLTPHPTEKPEALLETIISTLSVENDVVADFFAGSGTTLVGAARLGRHFFGCDANGVYVDWARERVRNTQPPLFVMQPEQQEIAWEEV
uniref:Putative methyltransferase n=1 Tax=viral metagenome TaxID=1070528 RepID=A0A6M3M277_9ZZZZ